MKIKSKKKLSFIERVFGIFSKKKNKPTASDSIELPAYFPPGSAGGGGLPKPGKKPYSPKSQS